MKKRFTLFAVLLIYLLPSCQETNTKVETPKETHELLGYSNQEAWGEHLVATMGCDDCHSPKVMTEKGPIPNLAFRLSGHPAGEVVPSIDRSTIEKNGMAACNSHFTAWIGPWGISYAANLTSDPSGIGNWSEEQFIRAIREGKYKGLESGRELLPPMPWPNYAKLNDKELKAMLAYLKTVPPVANVVPAPEPPVTAMK
ncbi:MAG: diheme cytochrome c-553 [Bacteroidetes bacterium]|nr:MAG: diheme cytochrome c-553 [Bacteroidota bacterium]REK00978.1 MAG: diheme cytochrome c-553 [Bacteroidota bacterium]REK34581.1 MAG: diheme cytochrome c-553 [Bacteroidota bacterium]REK51840.1 MAG: diheme cytochrome c-553 [Bacteroidota bacterium]